MIIQIHTCEDSNSYSLWQMNWGAKVYYRLYMYFLSSKNEEYVYIKSQLWLQRQLWTIGILIKCIFKLQYEIKSQKQSRLEQENKKNMKTKLHWLLTFEATYILKMKAQLCSQHKQRTITIRWETCVIILPPP